MGHPSFEAWLRRAPQDDGLKWLAGKLWGLAVRIKRLLSLALRPKSDVSDFGVFYFRTQEHLNSVRRAGSNH
jgi:hypothetical protein